MTGSSLPISRLINTSVNLASAGASAQNTSQLLIVGTSTVIDPEEQYRTYTSIEQVAVDFGTTAPEYKAAVLWFEQMPQPTSLLIGRWVDDDSSAYLRGGTLSAFQQALSAWTAITAGSIHFSVNGDSISLTALNFGVVTNMNGVASVINAALATASADATFVWNSSYQRFELTTDDTGDGAEVGFCTAGTGGTDILAMTRLGTGSGAYVVQGEDAVTALAAVQQFNINFGQIWYAITVLGVDDDDSVNIGGYIEASTNRHMYALTTQDPTVLNSDDSTSIFYLMSQLAYKHSCGQYSSSNPYAVVSLLARILTTDYTANNTVITLMYKQEPGIVPETLNETQLGNLEATKGNVFVAYNNNTAIIENGTVFSGDFIDTIIGTDWLALNIQTAVYNLLYTTPTKIPQTDAGNHQIATTIASICSMGVNNGLLAPGVWNQSGFGSLAQGDYLPDGFYVYAPPIANQLQADRAARKSVTFQVAAKLAGAIQTVDILINVNR